MTARVWTMPDIAARLGVTPEVVRQWLAREKLPEPTGRVQRSPWWSADDIEAWMVGWKRGNDARERERAASAREEAMMGPGQKRFHRLLSGGIIGSVLCGAGMRPGGRGVRWLPVGDVPPEIRCRECWRKADRA